SAPTAAGTAFGAATEVEFTAGEASVDVVFHRAGTAALEASDGTLTGAGPEVTVSAGPFVAVALPAEEIAIDPGQDTTLTATATDAHGNALAAGTFTWSSSNTAVATVDAAGLVN